MISHWPNWKKWTSVALGVLVLADLAFGFMVWQSAREGPDAMRARHDRLAAQAKLFRADVERGEKIRKALPQVGKDCDAFYQREFLNDSTGYARIEADLDSIAANAGVQTSGLAFKQSAVKGRDATQISITTTVDGDYPSILRFIDGIEKSKDFYLFDELNLVSAGPNAIRLQVALHTYFRT